MAHHWNDEQDKIFARLAVSDDPEVSRMLSGILRKNGYTVSFSGRGEADFVLLSGGEDFTGFGRPAVYLPDSGNLTQKSAEYAENFACCVIDYDCGFREKLSNCKILTYSMDSDSADFTVRNLRQAPDNGFVFEVVGVGLIGRIRVLDGSRETVKRLLVSAAAALVCGVPFAGVLDALNRRDAAEEKIKGWTFHE